MKKNSIIFFSLFLLLFLGMILVFFRIVPAVHQWWVERQENKIFSSLQIEAEREIHKGLEADLPVSMEWEGDILDNNHVLLAKVVVDPPSSTSHYRYAKVRFYLFEKISGVPHLIEFADSAYCDSRFDFEENPELFTRNLQFYVQDGNENAEKTYYQFRPGEGVKSVLVCREGFVFVQSTPPPDCYESYYLKITPEPLGRLKLREMHDDCEGSYKHPVLHITDLEYIWNEKAGKYVELKEKEKTSKKGCDRPQIHYQRIDPSWKRPWKPQTKNGL